MEDEMGLRKLFGRGDDDETPQEEGGVTIRVEVNGKTYRQWYPDLAMAQIRFPQYLADLNALIEEEES